MEFSQVEAMYHDITKTLIAQQNTISTMESCTSGFLASLITDTEGSSAIFPGGFVTYSNEGKIEQGVPAEIIDAFGVYSQETAIAMATACRITWRTTIGLGITGSFGNVDPLNADSVPGIVHFAFCTANTTKRFSAKLNTEPSRFAYKVAIAGIVGKELRDFCSCL